MKEEQLDSMLTLIGAFIGIVIILEILPWIIIGMIESIYKIGKLIKEYKRLGREKK